MGEVKKFIRDSYKERDHSAKMDIKLLNVVILGFGFMFLFTAFQTMGNIQVS